MENLMENMKEKKDNNMIEKCHHINFSFQPERIDDDDKITYIAEYHAHCPKCGVKLEHRNECKHDKWIGHKSFIGKKDFKYCPECGEKL